MKALNIFQINIFQHLLFIINHQQDNLPSCFNDIFLENSTKRSTRHSDFYKVPFKNTKRSQFAFDYRSPSLFNAFFSYIEHILGMVSFDIFKKKLKSLLLCVEDYNLFF